MADNIFSRFKPAQTAQAPGAVDDDSGLAHRSQASAAHYQLESEILTAIENIPAMPAIVQRILEMVADNASSAADIERLIRQDMVISARLLRLVNSPFYGLGHNVVSISQAVALIGFASLKSLVMAASVSHVMSLDVSAYGFTERGLWKNSIATAALSRAIAVQINQPNQQEEYFLAGLMKDIGMLVLGPFMKRAGASLRRVNTGNAETDLLRRERTALGFDHCWVGDKLGEKWNLPKRLRMCVAKHHRIPTDATPPDLRHLAGIRLAERLSYTSNIGVVADHPFETQVDGILLRAAGLDSKGFQTLMRKVPGIIAGTEINLD
jgi:HD-like signal output (HDOD) protein